MKRLSRRNFLKSTLGAAGAVAAFNISGTTASGKVIGANERFRVGVCGLKGRGGGHAGSYVRMKNVELAYVIDPDRRVLGGAVNGFGRRAKGYKVKGLTDVRKALEDKNLDAISVATPNHWHSLMVIWAAQAGKNCYVEKPASHDIYQGRVAAEAYKKYGVIVQHGTQQRSSSARANQMKAIRDGKYGKLTVAYGYCCKPRGGIGQRAISAPPKHLDWDLWRGPAVIDKYHGNYVHYNWHWFWASGNGDLNNQGTHQLDVARWAIAEDQTNPVRAMAIGGRFKWNDQGETPNTMFGIAEYPNGQQVLFNVRNVNYKGYRRQVMNDFYFEDGGWIDSGGNIDAGGRYHPAKGKTAEKVTHPDAKITPGGMFGSFVAACRAGDQKMINGNMLEAHYSCVTGHVMNLSYRLGKKVPFNAKAGKFGDDKTASEHFLKLHELMKGGVGLAEDKAEYIVGPWLTLDPKTERFTGDHSTAANKLLRDPHRKGFEIPDIGKA